ncbi:hypothetical protein BRADI_3g06566v3, partial [Brachypodium distachyon]
MTGGASQQNVLEEEGFVEETPKGRGGRQPNFTVEEDVALCLAWEAITLDAICGVEQTGNTYWSRIQDHFVRNKKAGYERSQGSLSHRWSTISDNCSKWSSGEEQVERLNPSGANAQDRTNIAQQRYKELMVTKGGKPGKAFSLFHCQDLLKHCEKWKTKGNDIPNRRKSSHSSSPDVENVDESDDSDEDGKRSPTPISVAKNKRPLGRKAEKEKAKKGGDPSYKEGLEMTVSIRRDLAAERKQDNITRWQELKEIEERRVAAIERKAAMTEKR